MAIAAARRLIRRTRDRVARRLCGRSRGHHLSPPRAVVRAAEKRGGDAVAIGRPFCSNRTVLPISLSQLAPQFQYEWAQAVRSGRLRIAVGDGTELSVSPSSIDGGAAFTLSEPGGGLRRIGISSRGVGRFQLQLNEARALRPPLLRDRCAFVCDDRRHPLSIVDRAPRLTIEGLDLACLPQGFPIDPRGHWLIVPTAGDELPHRPQRLTEADVVSLLELSIAAPGALVFYNSLDAGGGTVDHLHAQLLTRLGRLPIEAIAAPSRVLTPVIGWPVAVLCGRPDGVALATAVMRLQDAAPGFNLLLRGGSVFLAGRLRRTAPAAGLTVAALELGGLFIVSEARLAATLDAAALAAALRETVLPLSRLRAAVGA